MYSLLDMVFRIVRQLNDNLRRRVRRAFLAEPDKTPQRIATVMASILLISIVITYNVLYEREKAKGRERLLLILCHS